MIIVWSLSIAWLTKAYISISVWAASDMQPTVKNTFALSYYFCEQMAYTTIIIMLSTDITCISL